MQGGRAIPSRCSPGFSTSVTRSSSGIASGAALGADAGIALAARAPKPWKLIEIGSAAPLRVNTGRGAGGEPWRALCLEAPRDVGGEGLGVGLTLLLGAAAMAARPAGRWRGPREAGRPSRVGMSPLGLASFADLSGDGVRSAACSARASRSMRASSFMAISSAASTLSWLPSESFPLSAAADAAALSRDASRVLARPSRGPCDGDSLSPESVTTMPMTPIDRTPNALISGAPWCGGGFAGRLAATGELFLLLFPNVSSTLLRFALTPPIDALFAPLAVLTDCSMSAAMPWSTFCT